MNVREAKDALWSALVEVRDGEPGSPEVAANAVEDLIRAVIAEQRPAAAPDQSARIDALERDRNDDIRWPRNYG